MSALDISLRIVEDLLLLTIAVTTLQNHAKLEWLRATLVPWFTSLSRFINPEKK